MAEVEWMETQAREAPPFEFAARGDAVPIFGRGREAARLVAGARVEKIRRRRLIVEAEARIGFGREDRHIVILENEIAEAVEDRPALVDFDAEREMGAVARDDIGAGVDRRMREL